VNEFGTYSVELDGKIQIIPLQRCSECGAYLRLDGVELPQIRIISREGIRRGKMRTVTANVNTELYERLANLAMSETGANDPTKIMDEILSLGLKQYELCLKTASDS
jgi:hypothetical protein